MIKIKIKNLKLVRIRALCSLMKKQAILSFFFSLVFTSHLSAQELSKNVTTAQLGNGFNLVLIENHSLPMIASVVTVNAGSINETREINGISHMLEHLLFNGTSSRTQEQLYHDQDYYGIYINAHTGKNFTNYIVLAEKDFIGNALDIQADMLFHSTFPEVKFEKEKGIILNELARDSSDDSYWAEEFFNRKFYRNTPFNLTVLGTPFSIKQIKREQIIEYYKAYYNPNNMTALVMGDFQPDKMISLFEKYFGSTSPDKIPEQGTYRLNSKNIGHTYFQQIKSNNIYLNLGMPAPRIGDKDFYAFDLLVKILNLYFKDELNDRLKKKYETQVLELSTSFDFSKSLSSFTISAVLPQESDAETVKKEISVYLKEFISKNFNKNETNGLLTSLNVREQFLFEKPHYYGMMKGPWIATGGWEFTSTYIDRLTKVTVKELEMTGQKFFKNPVFLTCITIPGEIKPEFKQEEYYVSETNQVKFNKESILLSELWDKEKSIGKRKNKIKTTISKKQNPTDYQTFRGIKKSNFNNGLTFLVNSNSDSKVFAIHLLAKNRTALEPSGKEGIVEFLHRLIERRTGTRDKKQLTDALNSIGASLKTKDNPYIPYDNYYTSRKYSFIRFETIDDFYEEAIELFSDIVLNRSFLEEDIKEVKTEMTGLVRKNNESPSKVTANILNKELFKGNPLSRRIYGTEESISSITEKDLKNFSEYYFAPNNLIISVTTSVDKISVSNEFKKYFIKQSEKKTQTILPDKFPKFSKKKSIKFPLKKSQSYIRMGTLFKMKTDDEAGLTVLANLLSQRLAQNLREKKGLSYSLGAGFSTYNDYGLFEISVGTRPKTLNEAEKEIYKEIDNIKHAKIGSEELNALINYSNSRRLMRSLSRINQSYKMGLNEFYGKPFNQNEKFLSEVKKVKTEQVKNLARKYLNPENMVKVIVE